MASGNNNSNRGAVLDEGREYRYRLWRRGDDPGPVLAYIMLNPSTADETEDDATIRRCLGYAEDWGFGKVIVGNLFALRATDPSELRSHDDPVGPENDDHLVEIADESDLVVAAWGHHGGYLARGRAVAEMLDATLYALGKTQTGHPWHPLRKPIDVDISPFEYGVIA